METDAPTPTTSAHNLSTGAGIALAGIWLAAAAITITTLILWHLSTPPMPKTDPNDAWTAAVELLTIVLLIGWPEMVAWKITKWILGLEND